MRIIVCLLTMVAASCAGPVAIEGRYAGRLSSEDIRQIRALILSRREWAAIGPGPSFTVSADRLDHAGIATYQKLGAGQLQTTFEVTKRRGVWSVDNPDAEPIVTGNGESGGINGFGL